MGKKYRMLEEESIVIDGHKLYRIESLRNFDDVKIGDKGGFIESEMNLSHSGFCWIYDETVAFERARVRGGAKLRRTAFVRGFAEISQKAVLTDSAVAFGHAKISGCAKLSENAYAGQSAVIYGQAAISGAAIISEAALVCGDAEVRDATVRGFSRIYGSAKVRNARILGAAEICGNAVINSDADYIVFKNWWSSGRYFTWTRSNNAWKVGCFYGDGARLVAAAYENSVICGREYARIVNYVNSIIEQEKVQK